VTAVGDVTKLPAERWERERDRLRFRVQHLLGRHPSLASSLIRGRVWALWAALGLLLVMVAVFPRYRQSLVVYACCFWILIVWFFLARTKTITWVGLARMFCVGVVWAWVIAWVSYQLAGWAGLKLESVGAATAIAAFTEESLKLFPLIVLAAIAPGRVRRFAAVDWLLLGLAAGLGFQAWEDLLRRLAAQVVPRPPDAIELQPGVGP
jgi:RsiW-degrading membrane proteinase PrsW (M82 family)